MLKTREIYIKSKQYDHKLGKAEVEWGIRELYINPRFVVTLRENLQLQAENSEAPLLSGLDSHAPFTEIAIATPTAGIQKINIVGQPDSLIQALIESRSL